VSASVPGRRRRSPRRRAPPRRPSRLKAIPGVARAIAGGVGLVATVIGLVFVLWPSLKPEGPPADQGATLSNAQVDTGMTFGAYLDRISQSRRPYDAATLVQRGAYVEFDFVVRGYKGRHLPLGWQLLDAGSGAPLGQSRALRLTPKADRDAGSWSFWIPLARSAPHMYAQIALYNLDGVPVGRVRSAVFRRAGP
jgi:hypothetical protein